MKSNARYIELLKAQGRRHALVDGVVWERRGQLIEPIGPALYDRRLDPAISRHLFRTLGGLLINCPGALDSRENAPWYVVLATAPVSLDKIKSKERQRFRKALETFSYRKATVEEFLDQGRRVDLLASSRFVSNKHYKPRSESQFRRYFGPLSDFQDIVEIWAGFTHDGKMVTWTLNYMFDEVEVAAGTERADPSFLGQSVVYGLNQSMSEHYLESRGFLRIVSGYRSVLHETGTQEFLIRRLGYQRVGVKLQIGLRPGCEGLLRVANKFPSLVRRSGRLNAAVQTWAAAANSA